MLRQEVAMLLQWASPGATLHQISKQGTKVTIVSVILSVHKSFKPTGQLNFQIMVLDHGPSHIN